MWLCQSCVYTWTCSSSARQATLSRGSFWQAKLKSSDDFRNFLTHGTTFHDLCMTLMTNVDDILMTVKTNGEDTLTILMTDGEDTLRTPFTTHLPCDYPAWCHWGPMLWHDDLYYINCPNDWDQVTKRTTRWWQGQLTTLTDDVANLLWRQMWQLRMSPDGQSANINTTQMTLTTTGDHLWQSMWWPVDDPGNFLMTSDNYIWRYLSPKSKVACLAGSIAFYEILRYISHNGSWWSLEQELET